jgi:hypothetical protein
MTAAPPQEDQRLNSPLIEIKRSTVEDKGLVSGIAAR